ncbi:hypothetical protein J2D73_16670 [Acetobacter sacchari]|uniref:Uncharacterized protein n=1 Tax=Acetobacter sacchari TaxID=2661687 RepID=A0ABS3LZS7_9PROT|nr:hypothetical protein [Acetobacter sacchari]MBO1361420.1 hypothetical protein [Acetobacter sacchari]
MLKTTKGRTCAVCAHPDLASIDADAAAGATQQALADKYGLHRAAIQRHLARHLGRAASPTVDALPDDAPIVPIDELERSARRLRAVLDEAERKGLPKRDIGPLNREYRQCLESLAKARAAAEVSAASDVTLDSDRWQTIRTKLADALAPYADARRAVANALEGIDAP